MFPGVPFENTAGPRPTLVLALLVVSINCEGPRGSIISNEYYVKFAYKTCVAWVVQWLLQEPFSTVNREEGETLRQHEKM